MGLQGVLVLFIQGFGPVYVPNANLILMMMFIMMIFGTAPLQICKSSCWC
jgi:hypothetical protein